MISRRNVLRAGAGLVSAGTVGLSFAPSWAAGTDRAARVPWNRLERRLRGSLVLPTDPDYPRARHLALLQFDAVSPQAIAYCATENDIRECVLFARHHALPVTPRSGGHNLAGWSTTTGLVIDLSRIAHVTPGADTVRVGPGAQAVDILAALAPHGMQLPAGLCATVCPGGFVTGGGIGMTTRVGGLGADRLVSARVVLADGRIVHCSKDRHSELFWALRGGGGGNFGIVSEFEMRPTRIQRVAGYNLAWPWDRAADVTRAWQEWTANGPDALGGTLDLLLTDAAEGVQPLALVGGFLAGPRAELETLLDQLCSLVGSAPTSRETREQSYQAEMMSLWGCSGTAAECHLEGDNPVATVPRHEVIVATGRLLADPLGTTDTEAALTALESGRHAGQFHNLSMYALGGAAGRVRPDETAFAHRSARFFTGYSAGFLHADDFQESHAAAERWVDDGMLVIDPHRGGPAYINFPDLRLPVWQTSYYGANYPRLRRVKRHYDPDAFFHRPQSIEL
ncbi:FAD-binding protein [Streptomyces sp. SID8381]|uniref:FAD-binding oxidoreductase n=1 Tax=unclassified Streptomyces TaxID=2593676 RepID=UPI00036C1ACC|nr:MULTISPECIES: FAD-binding oxidoreductase [unclassified Streptomyces]MYX30127.1 FAD-binding protein [Streptomyces sp. SID8381]